MFRPANKRFFVGTVISLRYVTSGSSNLKSYGHFTMSKMAAGRHLVLNTSYTSLNI